MSFTEPQFPAQPDGTLADLMRRIEKLERTAEIFKALCLCDVLDGRPEPRPGIHCFFVEDGVPFFQNGDTKVDTPLL